MPAQSECWLPATPHHTSEPQGTGMEKGAGSALLPDSDSQLLEQLTAPQSTTYQFSDPLGLYLSIIILIRSVIINKKKQDQFYAWARSSPMDGYTDASSWA